MSRAAEAIDRFLSIMSRLRSPDGCPWDREQTLESLRPCLLEETYEVLEAIEDGSTSNHCEELGDLLLQIVFQAEIRMEEGAFDFADLTQGISDKLVSRHPHVFGDAKVKDAEGVLHQWAVLKQKEKQSKGGGRSVLEGVPRELPALARADRLTEKAGRVGFDWPTPSGARRKVEEELRELDEAIAAGDQSSIEHELGDLLFAVANLGRKLAVSPEEALRGTLRRFLERFEFIERELAARGVAMGDASLEQMDELWNRAKQLFSQRAKSP